MMQTSVFKRWLFVLAISRIQGLGELWKMNDYVNHRIMEIILDSCYENDSVSNPTLIFGNFRGSIGKSSIIRLNQFFYSDIEEEYIVQRIGYKASRMILVEDSPEQLAYDLHLLSETRWWNHTASFFIVERNDDTCRNAKEMLMISWKLNILNAIYICTESGKTTLVTFNPITNYAPSPWKMIEGLENYHLFHQYFDLEISCANLHYDKTRIIRGHEIKIGCRGDSEIIPGAHSFEEIIPVITNSLELRLLQCVVESLNATSMLEFTKDGDTLIDFLHNASIDITADTVGGFFIYSSRLIVYPDWPEMIAVIKLGPEISTLTKISQLWDIPVLIVAAVAIGILFIVLTVLSHDWSFAMLDLTRLLTYTSILINNRSHKFRVYFASMLILIVISNGVFQGSIAAFLTKQERESPVGTIDDLIELKYKIYSPPGQDGMNEYVCPTYHIEETSLGDCIDLVLNSSRHACLIQKEIYEEFFNLEPLTYVKVSAMRRNTFFISRLNYPLRDRIQKSIMKIFESGIIDKWKNELTYWQKEVRQEIEAEWSSAQYKPIKLYKLMFAFHVLALGLSISTIVFIFELLVANYGKFHKIKRRISISLRNIRERLGRN